MEKMDKDHSKISAEPTSIVGALLRKRREELNQEIEDVSAQLRIRPAHLRAIEAGKMQELPGIAYTIGFVRSYADYLGLEGKLIVADYRNEMAQRSRAHHLAFPTGHAQGRLPGLGFIITSIGLIVGLYVGWQYWGNDLGSLAKLSIVEAVPHDFSNPSTPTPQDSNSTPANQQNTAPATPTSESNGGTPPSGAPNSASNDVTNNPGQLPGGVSVAAMPAGNTAQNNLSALNGQAQAPQSAPAPVVSPAPQPATNAALAGIQLVARQDSWVDIRDANNQVVFSRVLRQGESYAVPLQTGLTLTTGNAGGLDVIVNGRTLPSLGGVGLVRRDIPLDEKKLLETQPVSGSPTPVVIPDNPSTDSDQPGD